MHTDDSVISVFRDIAAGKIENASFSDANVIMLSRNHYDAMHDRIAVLEAEKAERERQEPVAYRYKFPATWGGFVWKESPDRYNGSPPLESQALYAHPLAIREPTDEECERIARASTMTMHAGITGAQIGRAMFNAVRSVLGGEK